jgi:putative transposase
MACVICVSADDFEQQGMLGLFSSEKPHERRETERSLPSDMRHLIVDLHTELPTMSWREIVGICSIRFGRKPSHHSVKHTILVQAG